MSWSADSVARLRELVDQGLTAEVIGTRMGVGKNAVIGKCYRLGLKLHGSHGPAEKSHRSGGVSWSADSVARLRKLVDQGLTAEVIGTRMGVGKNAVLGKCYRLGLKLHGSPGPKNTRKSPDWAKRQAVQQAIKAELTPRREVRGQCAWIDGDPSGDDWSYCGQPVEPERPYCLAHCERAYRRVTEDTAAEAAA